MYLLCENREHNSVIHNSVIRNSTGGDGCCFVLFCGFFPPHCFTYFVDATVSYDRKELLDISTAITHLELYEDFFL